MTKTDRIAVLNGGVLVEEGTHKELLGRKAAYAAMWQKQFPMFEESGV